VYSRIRSLEMQSIFATSRWVSSFCIPTSFVNLLGKYHGTHIMIQFKCNVNQFLGAFTCADPLLAKYSQHDHEGAGPGRKLLIVGVVLMLSGCGASKSMVTARYEKLETWQICKKILTNEMSAWKVPWANEVLQARGENCEKYIGQFQPPVVTSSPTRVCFPMPDGMVVCN
jgi:hypothetical protein